MEVVEHPDRLDAQVVGLLRQRHAARPRLRRIPAVVVAGPALGNDHAELHRPRLPSVAVACRRLPVYARTARDGKPTTPARARVVGARADARIRVPALSAANDGRRRQRCGDGLPGRAVRLVEDDRRVVAVRGEDTDMEVVVHDQQAQQPGPVGRPDRRENAAVDQRVEAPLTAAVRVDHPDAHGARPLLPAFRHIHDAVECDALAVGRPGRVGRLVGRQDALPRTVGLDDDDVALPPNGPTATASSVPSGDHCGGNHCSTGLPSRSGPIRRTWRPPAAGAGRSHLGDVEAGGAAALTAQEGDPPAVGREPRKHAVRAGRQEPRGLRRPVGRDDEQVGLAGARRVGGEDHGLPVRRPRGVVVLGAVHISPGAARPQGGPVAATGVDHLDRVRRRPGSGGRRCACHRREHGGAWSDAGLCWRHSVSRRRSVPSARTV